MPVPSEDGSVCPLCGRGNCCGLERTGAVESCWCRAMSFSRESLARIPEGLRGRLCICVDCATLGPTANDPP